MKKYEVVSGCYVPMGNRVRFRPPGQVVTLSDEQAAALAGFIKPVAPSEGVAFCNTEAAAIEQPGVVAGGWGERVDQAEPEAVEQDFDVEEVISDVGDSQADYE